MVIFPYAMVLKLPQTGQSDSGSFFCMKAHCTGYWHVMTSNKTQTLPQCSLSEMLLNLVCFVGQCLKTSFGGNELQTIFWVTNSFKKYIAFEKLYSRESCAFFYWHGQLSRQHIYLCTISHILGNNDNFLQWRSFFIQGSVATASFGLTCIFVLQGKLFQSFSPYSSGGHVQILS